MTPSEGHTSFVTSRPVAVLMVVIAALVFGFFSYGRLPVTLMPELNYPTLTVRTQYPGAAPEEVENDVTRPIEEALGVIGGLRRVSSVSRAGLSDVVLEFSWDTKMETAIQDTLEKLDLVFLPQDASRPLVLRFDPSLDPVMELSLAGEGARFKGEDGLRRLRRVAELEVKRALEPIKGVAAVQVRGGLEEQIEVSLDANALQRTGISIQDVMNRLRQENVNVAGGTLKEGRTEYMVRTLNEYKTLDQIANTVIRRVGDREVRLSDLGTVRWGHADRKMITRVDGVEAVMLDVYKEADANMVAMSHRVRAKLGELDPAKIRAEARRLAGGGPAGGRRGRRRGGHGRPGMVPGGGRGGHRLKPVGLATRLFADDGVLIGISADRSVFIASAVNEVRNTAIYGGLLAIIVLFLFLKDIRSTAIIALSIPISLLVTFAPLNMMGVSLNIMSLGGLALGVGMLVDSSIVVLESIARCREEGDGVVESAVRGTNEVRNAVAASTFTSIAVFFPMVFVEGVAGQAFGDLGMAVVISLLASLVVAILLIPMLASRRGLDLEAISTAPALRRFAAWEAFRNDFASWPTWLRWPGLAYLVPRFLLGTFFELLGKAALLLLAGVFLAWRRVIGPVVTTTLRLVTRPLLALSTASLEAIQGAYPRGIRWALKHPIAILALALAAMVGTVFAMTGLDSELLPTVHQGQFTVEVTLPVGTPLEETDAMLRPVEQAILAHRQHIKRLLMTVGYDPANMKRSDEGENTARFKVILDTADPPVETAVADRIRALVANVPDAESRVVRPVLFSFRTPIEVDVYGHDLIRLQRTAERVRQLMSGLPELADVETTQRKGAPEVQIVYNRDRLIRAGLDIEQVAQEVQAAVKGDEATRFNLTDRRVPIVVRYALPYRRTVEDIRRIIVNPGGDRPIPLAAVAKVIIAEGPSEVRRVDGRRVAMVTANIAHGSLGHAVDRIRRLLGSKMTWPSDMSFFIAGQSEEWARSRKSLLLAMALAIFLVYAIMAAQFESLLQPLIIMLSIPLAFFGSALALHLLHISLSVVVFLGMIMLAGIVVNNAIVLVDYINILRGRGVPRDEAIVTAGSVRLRPILMTTATTVLGLAPMAMGFGDGAELRSPMAVTVIAGLLTSTLLTLVVVPSFYQVLERAVDRFRRRATAIPEVEASREVRH